MWLKHQGIYYNLERQNSISFRKNTIALNYKCASYIQIPTRFPLSQGELSFITELFESAIELRREIFDMDALYEKFKKR